MPGITRQKRLGTPLAVSANEPQYYYCPTSRPLDTHQRCTHSQLTKRSRVAWVESKGIDFTSQRGQRIDLTFGPTNKPIAIIVALSRVGPYLWEVVGIESYLKGRSSVWDAFNWSESSLLFKREVEPDS